MAAAAPRRRPKLKKPAVPQKGCVHCGYTMSGEDGHQACIFCLGKAHATRGLNEGARFCKECGDIGPKHLRRRLTKLERPKPDNPVMEQPGSRPPSPLVDDVPPVLSWSGEVDLVDPIMDTGLEDHVFIHPDDKADTSVSSEPSDSEEAEEADEGENDMRKTRYRMENMEGPAVQQHRQRQQQNAKKNRGQRKQQQKLSSEIVFTRGSSIKTIASLVSQLQGVTEPIIGLHYVWEYRSPSKSVPPHYQCKLCAVSRLQNEMLAHIKGWKHGFKYMKRVHPNKITGEEEDAKKDPAFRKHIRDIAAEVEKAEGRGQLKVILKEPCDVLAFKGLHSAIPKAMPPMGQEMGMHGPRLGGRFPGEFPPQAGPQPNFKMGGRREPGFGGYAARPDFPELDMGPRQFPDGMSHHHGGGDGFGRNDRDDFGMSGPLVDSPGRRYPDELRGGQMGSSLLDRPMDRQMDRPGLMGADPDSSSLLSTLLNYLDTFRIENESDAQIVLKVTQKLTDVLMDYRLRSVSTGPSMSSLNNSMNNSSVSSMGYSSPPSRMPSAGDNYSGGRSGPSRYSDGPSRFYN